MSKPTLGEFLKPGKKLPSDEVMIAKALEILESSPHGQQLVSFVEKKEIAIKLMATPKPVAYLPETKLVYIGFNRNKPVSPSQFIMMLAGILREAQQEAADVKHPALHAPLAQHMEVSMAKHEDKLWYMCTVAMELNDQSTFTEYKFLDELRKMGHNEVLELYIKQERKK